MAALTAHMFDSGADGEFTGEFVISVRSVALNTDLSMMDIDLLHAEVTALRKEVALLQHGISTGGSKRAELNHELYGGGGVWPSVLCKAEPSPVLIQKQGTSEMEHGPALRPCKAELHQIHLHHPDQFHRLDFFSGMWPALCCKTEPIPVLIVPQENPERVLNPLLTLKQELGLVPECKAEPYTSFMEEEEEEEEEDRHIFFKLEPEPVEIMELCVQERSAPSPLKTCSVKLVDCRRTLEKNTSSQSGEGPEEQHTPEDEVRSSMSTTQSAGTQREGEEHAPEGEERLVMSTTQSAGTRGEDEEHAPEDEDRLSMSTTQDVEMCNGREEDHAPEDEERVSMFTTQSAGTRGEDEEDHTPEGEERWSLEDEEQSFTSADQREASVGAEVRNESAGRNPGPHQWRKGKRRNRERLFPCSFCERSFFKRCNLGNHLRVHCRETTPPAHQQQ